MDTHGIRRDRGRVEMEVGGQWSSLCMYPNTAPVICRQLGFPYAAMLTNASTPASSLFGHRELLANEVAFYCLGYEAKLFDCEQEVWYGYCTTNYIITCSGSPYLRILYDKHLYPPLEGTNLTLECESLQSGQSNVTFRWYRYSRHFRKYLIFDKVTRQHQGLKVRCMADYVYDGLTYRVVSDILVMNVCCAPSIKSTNRPPPELLHIAGDEGHLSIEMTAYPTPHLKNMAYLGQVLNKSIKGKNIENLAHVDCNDSLVSRASVTCSITVFNISQIAKGFYKTVFSNRLGDLPFIFTVNRNTARSGERSRVLWIVGSSSFGGVVTAAAIFLVCHLKNDVAERK
ncbi:uncharacterized protein LOC112569318 isoform X2 [Pomacea canaliculata]|uniref:uncharacterized protein LOC112569318 isoform X2 n=1 Tax=Pomacea canaliculata TaxID=400727 RepID=UPI000D7358B5|nr:uncharacterized protein LOC112569318 isoform X2 [Pomacea canaliculata]